MALTAIPTARREADALARPVARLVAAASVVLALWLLGEVAGDLRAFWWPAAAWGAGLVVSFALPQTRLWFASVSGVIAGLIIMVALLILFMLVSAMSESPVEPPSQILLLALVPVGLDWHLVVRLRARVLASGFLVIVLVGLDGSDSWATSKGGGSLLMAMAWFAVALAALWLLHRDQIGALPRPAPLGGQAVAAPPVAPGDFLLIALVSALVAVVIALLVAGPSCLPWEGCGANPDPLGELGMPGDLPNPDLDGLGDSGSRDQWGNSGSGSMGGGDPGTSNASGYFYDGEGRAYAYDPETDTYLRVPRGDAYGFDPESGYHYDGDGNAYTYDELDDAYRRAPGGDALVPDPDGNYFYKDREGEYWIPSENGKPMPPDAEVIKGRMLDGGVVIDGVIVPGGSGLPQLPPDAELADPEALDGPQEADDDEIDWGRFLLVLGGLLLVVGLIGLAIWWWRRQADPEPVPVLSPVAPDPWAEAMVRRLVTIGARHGRARGRGESVETYATVLATDPALDQRLAKVGMVVSNALFGGTDTPPEHRVWVEGVLDQVEAADAVAQEMQDGGRGHPPTPVSV